MVFIMEIMCSTQALKYIESLGVDDVNEVYRTLRILRDNADSFNSNAIRIEMATDYIYICYRLISNTLEVTRIGNCEDFDYRTADLINRLLDSAQHRKTFSTIFDDGDIPMHHIIGTSVEAGLQLLIRDWLQQFIEDHNIDPAALTSAIDKVHNCIVASCSWSPMCPKSRG